MKKFSFIGYPLRWDLWYKYRPEFEKYSQEQAKVVMKQTPPFFTCNISGVRSINGEQIEGELILIPLLPEQILELDPSFVVNRIVEAGRIAQERGAKIIGLGGLTSVVGDQGRIVAKKLEIAVTTGNTYTAAMTAEATQKAVEIMGIKLRKAKVAIIGATGSIGTICSHIFAEKAAVIRVVARNLRRLRALATLLNNSYKSKIEVLVEIDDAIRDADVIIATTNSPTVLIDVEDLKPGCVVCDVATPRNVSYSSKRLRKDVLVIDGGLIKPPGKMKMDVDIGLPPGIAYACLSETMILTFENRYENYTLGRGLSLDKVKEITALGKKHGFSLSEFKSFGKPITRADVNLIKERTFSPA